MTVAFYIVLGIAIGLGAFITGFLIYIMRLMPHKLSMKVMSTLHALAFGYETALVELIGPRGYKTHVFPKIVETIGKLKGEDPLVDAVVNAETPEAAMESWIKVLQLIGISKDAHLVKRGEDEYTINIPNCMMHDPIHTLMGLDAKGICPMALIVAAASSFVPYDKTPAISYSKFSPTGTATDLKFEAQ
jgi:hypothetical protein